MAEKLNFDRIQQEVYLDILGEAEYRLAEVRYTESHLALIKEFGRADDLSGEEIAGVAESVPLIAAIDKAVDLIQKCMSEIRAKLSDDGSNPPF